MITKFLCDKIRAHDFIITLGFYNPALLPKCDMCFYPFFDCEADSYVRYEVGTEEGVLALFLYEFAKNSADCLIQNFINALDYGYLSAETNVSEEEFIKLKNLISTCQNPLLIIGTDIAHHAQKSNILNIISALKAHSNLEILCDEVLPQNFALNQITSLPEHNGCVIFVAHDSRQNISQTPTLKISREFARAWRLSDRQEIRFTLDSQNIRAICDLSADFSGIIGILHGANGLKPSYPFKNITIAKG